MGRWPLTLALAPHHHLSANYRSHHYFRRTYHTASQEHVSLSGIHDIGSSLSPPSTRRSGLLLALPRKASPCQPSRRSSPLRHRALRRLLRKGFDQLPLIATCWACTAQLSVLPSQPHRREPKPNASAIETYSFSFPVSRIFLAISFHYCRPKGDLSREKVECEYVCFQ
jgi:hypothetical protein